MINKILNGDCLELMQDIPDKSIDMILCDLPFKITDCKWDQLIPFDKLWEQYERIIKDNGAIVLNAQQPFTTDLIMSNRKLFKYELIWIKDNSTGFLNSKYQPLKIYEHILIFGKKQCAYNKNNDHMIYNAQMRKGFKPYKCKQGSKTANYSFKENSSKYTYSESKNGERYPINVLKFKRDKEKIHSTQKPVKLFEYLIKTFTNENALVLDNCSGSGTTAIASINTNRNYICIEKDRTYFDLSIERVKNHTKPSTIYKIETKIKNNKEQLNIFDFAM